MHREGRVAAVLAVMIAACAVPTAAQAGPRWGIPEAVSKPGILVGSAYPTLGTDGCALVTWAQGKRDWTRTLRPWVAVRRPGAASFARPRRVGPRGSFAAAEIAEDENVAIVVRGSRGKPVRARLHSPLTRFGPWVTVARRAPGFSLDVARDGTAAIAWRTSRGLRASVREPGGEFGPAIAPVRSIAWRVDVAAGGGVVVASQRSGGRARDRRVFVSTRPPGAPFFGPPEPVPPTRWSELAAATITDDGRAVVLAEEEKRDDGTAIRASTAAAGGGFSVPRRISRGWSSVWPSLGADLSGRVVAVWDRIRGGGRFAGPEWAAYAPGAGWSTPERIPRAREMSIASFDISGSGAWALGIHDVRRRRQVLRAAIAPAGGSIGRPERITVARNARALVSPIVAINDAGEAIAAWAPRFLERGRIFISNRA
ncbi:MAG TPA: hypothetical protein VK919_08795 [Solirubrobacterales bacterium]|nr:hypothetical protein [Solirubrobacterales bacterium]